MIKKFVLEFIGSNLTILNIQTILMVKDFPASEADQLGIYLGIKLGRISTLKMNNNGNADRLLTAIIEEWLRNDKKPTLRTLADAVRRCHHSQLADYILKQYWGVKRKAISRGIFYVNKVHISKIN